MAATQSKRTITVPASADLSASMDCAMNVNTSGRLALPSAGGRVVGVLCNDPAAAGRPGELQIEGVARCKTGGAVTFGVYVKADASGRAVLASADDVDQGADFGIALSESGGANEKIAILLTGPGRVRSVGVEAVSTGDLDVYTAISELTIADTVAFALPDGLYVGQQHVVRVVAVSGTPIGTLTPDTVGTQLGGTMPATLVFKAVGQEATLEWRATGWVVIAHKAAGVETVVDAATINPLFAAHFFAVSGTDTAVLPSGMYPGEETYCQVISAAATPHITVSGLFYDEDGSADGITVALETGGAAAAGDRMKALWMGTRWVLTSHVNAAVSP